MNGVEGMDEEVQDVAGDVEVTVGSRAGVEYEMRDVFIPGTVMTVNESRDNVRIEGQTFGNTTCQIREHF